MVLLGVLTLTLGYSIFEWLNEGFTEHKHWVYSVDINDDGLIASASENQILLWENSYNTGIIEEHSDAVKSVSFSNDNSLIVSGGIDKKVNVWSLAESKVIKEFDNHSAGVNSVKFCSTDKYIISAGYDQKLFIWDWKKDSVIKELDIKHAIFSISQANILAYTDPFCNINLLDLNSLSIIKLIEDSCGILVFHPNGELLGIRDDEGIINIIDINSEENISKLNMNHKSHYSSFNFTPSGHNIVAGIWGGDIEIWDWKSRELIKTLNGTFGSSVNQLSFDKNNMLLTASGDRSVKVWNMESGKLESNLGDGLYKQQLLGILSLLIVISLSIGFFGVFQDSTNRYSNSIIMLVLTIWTCGLFLITLFIKEQLSNSATKITWIFTILSGLFVLSLYGSWLAIFTIPISLSMGYLRLKCIPNSKGVMIPIILNLVLVGIISSFVVSAGLWK